MKSLRVEAGRGGRGAGSRRRRDGGDRARPRRRFDASLTGYEEVPDALDAGASARSRRRSAATGRDPLHAQLSRAVRRSGERVTQAHIHLGARARQRRHHRVPVPATSATARRARRRVRPTRRARDAGRSRPAQVVGPADQGIAPAEFAELVRALRAGAAYANVHTTTNAGGEIRGQIAADDRRSRRPPLSRTRAPANAGALSFRRVADDKRMRLRGLHHVTAICRDLERTIAFYRDVLGLAIVHDAPSDDDPDARHVWFGAGDGTFVSFMEYPARCRTAWSGVGSTHHFALRVDSAEEQEAWRDYLREHDVDCTDVLDRGAFRSIYVARSRRPRRRDRHARRPASAPAGRPPSGPARRRRIRSRSRDQGVARRRGPRSAAAPAHCAGARSSSRWSWSPTIGIDARNRRQRVRPQRCWLISRSAMRHALRLPRALEHDLGHGRLTLRHLALELGARQPHAVGLRERPHVLWRRCCRSCFHRTSPLLPTLARWESVVLHVPGRERARTRAPPAPRTRQCGVHVGHP